MAEIERVITIALPEPMVGSVRAAVEAGEYASTSEVVFAGNAKKLFRLGWKS